VPDIITRQKGLSRGFKGFDFMSEREEEIDWHEFIQEVRQEQNNLFFDFWFFGFFNLAHCFPPDFSLHFNILA